MKHILFDIHYPTFGGPHNQALQLAEPLRERNWQTHVLLPDEGNAADRLRHAGVRVIQAPLRRLRASPNPKLHIQFIGGLGKEIGLIRRLIREHDIDVVMIAGLYTVQTAIAARLERVPVVWQILDTRTPDIARKTMMPIVVKLADSVMTTGVEVARQHPGAIELGDRWVPYYPPVDTDVFRPDPGARARARSILGVPDDALLVGTVGNLNRTKGQLYFVETARQVTNSHPNTYFRMLGAFTPTHAKYGHEVHAAIESSGLKDGGRFAVMDPQDKVRDLIPAFDLFVSTSVPRSEGVPTTILEAMATGLPVVSTAVGGVAEIIEDGSSGFVVPPLDTEAISRSINLLLGDAHLRQEMGSRARQRAVSDFNIERCVDAHIRAFDVARLHRS